jgi:hypothetical protein
MLHPPLGHVVKQGLMDNIPAFRGISRHNPKPRVVTGDLLVIMGVKCTNVAIGSTLFAAPPKPRSTGVSSIRKTWKQQARRKGLGMICGWVF